MSKEVEKEHKDFFLPQPGSVEYTIFCADKAKQKKLVKTLKNINRFIVVPLYRIGILPLFGAGFIFLLLFTVGRKTGKKRITPLEYRKIDGFINIFASRGSKTNWLKNIKANPDKVKVRIGFRKFDVRPEVLSVEERKEVFEKYVQKYPKAVKELIGWDNNKHNLNNTDLTKIAELIPIVRLHVLTK